MSKKEKNDNVYDDTEIHEAMNSLGKELDKIIEDIVDEIINLNESN